jgi:hypothetical protein
VRFPTRGLHPDDDDHSGDPSASCAAPCPPIDERGWGRIVNISSASRAGPCGICGSEAIETGRCPYPRSRRRVRSPVPTPFADTTPEEGGLLRSSFVAQAGMPVVRRGALDCLGQFAECHGQSKITGLVSSDLANGRGAGSGRRRDRRLSKSSLSKAFTRELPRSGCVPTVP